MLAPDLLLFFVKPCNDFGIRYMIGGSVASIFYGEPRLTHDIDMVVYLRYTEVMQLQSMFPSPEFYTPPTETIFTKMAREKNGHFNLIHVQTGLKADLSLWPR